MASASSSTRAQALYQLGVTRLAQGDLREAYEDLKEASRLEPHNLEIMLKYEEAYSAARELLAEEHERQALNSPELTSNYTSKSASSSPYSTSSRSPGPKAAQSNDLPPTFTFVGASTEQLPEGMLTADSGSDERHLPFTKGLLDSEPFAPDARRMAELGFSEATPVQWQHTLWQGHHQEAPELGINMQSPKLVMASIFCWLVIWLIVTYYYQIAKKHHENRDVSVPKIMLWTCVILSAGAGAWRFATHCRVKYLSMSDGIKMTCGIVIVIAVLWHKLWQEPQWKESSNTTSIRA